MIGSSSACRKREEGKRFKILIFLRSLFQNSWWDNFKLTLTVTLHAVRCIAPQETPIPPEDLFWGALQTNTQGPETWKCCNSIWSWGLVEDLLTCHSPHWWNMPASVLNHKPLAQELRLKESGVIFNCWTLGWWQKGVSVEVGINTLPGWSRWFGFWKPCQSRCSWPETQYFPLPATAQREQSIHYSCDNVS